MYARLRDGLLGPKHIVNYIKDKWFRPLIQLLLYGILALIPIVIQEVKYKGLDYDMQVAIRQCFDGEEIDFKTENYVLVSTGEQSEFKKSISDLYVVIINTNDASINRSLNTLNIVLAKDEVYLSYYGIKIEVSKYSEYEELKDFDFSKLSNQNNTEEWDIIMGIINKIVTKYHRQYIVPTCISEFIQILANFAITALFLSLIFLFRFRRIIRFGAMYKLSIYYLVPYMLGTIVTNIFNLGIFSYIGFIISVIYVIIGSNDMLQKLVSQRSE